MAHLTFDDIISSKPYKFLVGPEKREFTIHSALVTAHSPVLDRLMNGEFREAEQGYAELEEVSEETFALFAQYAYTGTYNYGVKIAKPGAENATDDTTKAQPKIGKKLWATAGVHANYVWNPMTCQYQDHPFEPPEPVSRFHSRDKDMASTERAALWARLEAMVREVPSTSSKSPARTSVTDAESCFTTNAQIFVFADCYGIKVLADTALRKLGEDLVDRKPLAGKREMGDFLRCLEYCFEQPTPDKVRHPLALFVACHAQRLWREPGFQQLLEDQGDLASAILQLLLMASESEEAEGNGVFLGFG